MFGRRKKYPDIVYDPERMRPVLLSSICTGEKTAGFRDRESGHFTGVCLIRDEKDLQKFKKDFGITEEIRQEY